MTGVGGRAGRRLIRLSVSGVAALAAAAGAFGAGEVVQAPDDWRQWPMAWPGKPARAANRIDPASVPKVPAFPDAEGHGALSIGGRGGRVIKVTTLEPRGPGSLDEALRAKGPRIVVFDVSGVIRGRFDITAPHVTIAGQTAPGAGITIHGRLYTQYVRRRPYPKIHNVILRFIRVRQPRVYRKGDNWDCIRFYHVDRPIGDHCSMAWASDETTNNNGSTNSTWQWSTAEESAMKGGHSEGAHNYGMKGNGYPYGFMHHLLMAHHRKRCPSATAHVINNVVYDTRQGFNVDGRLKPDELFTASNVIGNYYKPGRSSRRTMQPISAQFGVPYYIAGNYIHGVGYIRDPWKEHGKFRGLAVFVKNGKRLLRPRPHPYFSVTVHTALDAYELVGAHAGCLPRDRVTRRTVQEVIDGTGRWGRAPGTPVEPSDEWYLEGLKPGKARPDADGDGMPDEWEKAHGLDPRNGQDHLRTVPKGASPADRHAGYTYIEYYVNELADGLIVGALAEWLDKHPDSKAVKKELARMRKFLPPAR